ncbi:MAG: calcium-binding protein [Enhydrobacter sp.]|nr:calcium-binding protein [Enhydrobacter sp.]
MPLTFAQAQQQIDIWKTSATAPTNAQIDALIAELSVRLDGSTSTVLYGGPLGIAGADLDADELVDAHDLAESLARQSEGRIGVIDNTDAGRILGGDDLREVLLRANGANEAVVDSRLYDLGGLWDTTSARFAGQLTGPVLSVVPFADAGRIWSQTELRALLNNADVSSINGITRGSILARYTALTESVGEAAAYSEIRDHLMTKSLLDGITSDIRLAPDGSAISVGERFLRSNGILDVGPITASPGTALGRYIDGLGSITRENLGRITRSAPWLLDVGGDGAKYVGNTLGTAVKYLGPVGDLLDGALSAARAYDLYRAGDIQGAITELTGFAGSLAGGYWGGAVGIGIAGLLGLSGPVGWGLAAALAIGGGLGGEAFSRWAANSLADLFDGVGGWSAGIQDRFAAAISAALRRLLDPIVIDMDGDGVELVSRAAANVYFDMDGDGIKELTGWLGKDDALLAIDENKNGTIDNINELIGDLVRSGSVELASYDLNGDRIIDRKDAIFGKLRAWIDANSNGLTDAGELKTMAEAGIKSFDLRFTDVGFEVEGNRIHEQSTFEWTNGQTGTVVDAWFDVSNVATSSGVTTTGNAAIDALPDIRGYGDVDSLRAAMAANGTLTSLVSDVVNRRTDQLGGLRGVVEQILFRWAGTINVDPASRGGLFDGRELATLEKFLGTPYRVQGVTNPTQAAVPSLQSSWDGLVEGVLARLLLSGAVGDVVGESVAYIPSADRILTIATAEELLAELKQGAPTGSTLAVANYWSAALPLARQTLEETGTLPSSAVYSALIAATLADSGLAPFATLLEQGVHALPAGVAVLTQNGVYMGTDAAEALVLTGGAQAIYGQGGDDRLSALNTNTQANFLLDGGEGSDTLQGGAGSDWLDGGAGADVMAGGDGNDTYGVDSAADLVIEGRGAGNDTVRSSIAYTLADPLENLVLLGSAGLSGVGNASANKITGNSAGNVLQGLDGDDILDGGAGNDTLYGGAGNDTFVVNSTKDKIVEEGSGYDTVRSAVNYTLGAKLEALQLVGAATTGTGNDLDNAITGNELNNKLNGLGGADAMAGGLGDDTYYVDNRNDRVTEAANAGNDTVISSATYALGTDVENLTLTGDLDVSGEGNALANILIGNSGENYLDGRGGADDMRGGAGDDTYAVDDAGDMVTESRNGGLDTVTTSLASYVLGKELENLQLYIGSSSDSVTRSGTGNTVANTIWGNRGANVLSGLAGDDNLYGQEGDDRLEGGTGNDWLEGGSGVDTMRGDVGDDTYSVDNVADVVTEAANGGTDTVRSTVSYALGADVENLLLLGYLDINGMGNSTVNRIAGNSGANRLDGGAAADTMIGGSGNDTYVVDDAGDLVVEGAGEGNDKVEASISYTLSDAIESVLLTGTAAISATGNASANQLTGNSAANILKGLAGNDLLDGGVGEDTMMGGQGDDTYIVDSLNDVIVEEGSGYDTVRASLNYTLSAKLEALELYGSATSATGNSRNNFLVGNELANSLDGLAGNDSMSGGLGDDTYFVDSRNDQVNENINGGIDTVFASVGYFLGANVEILTLTGNDDINADGNSLANLLVGNDGDNVLDGGAGADEMRGGLGNDTYVVESALDVIVELALAGVDTVRTALAAFTLGSNLENLQLFHSYIDSGARNGTGNELGNLIWGTNGANQLSGLAGDDKLFGYDGQDNLIGGAGNDWLDGGSGADTMNGDIGDDTYVVDNVADVVVEAANGGIDTVRSSIAFILKSNLENAVLTGSSAIDAQGNEAANTLTGNNANNSLDGGTGADTMIGGGGDDTYTVDEAGDRVIEAPGEGNDTVRSSINYVLGVGTENLELRGSGKLSGTGNEMRNNITGNSANNVIRGGYDGDLLTGNAGADRFVYDSVSDSDGATGWFDRIADFNFAEGDRIHVSGLDANSLQSGRQTFDFAGIQSNFTSIAQIRATFEGNNTYRLHFNTDSDSGSEMQIVVNSSTAPVGAWFI